MSIIQKIEDAFKNVTGLRLVGDGIVLETRAWQGSPLVEIDLHLPTVDMGEWTGLMKITFLISDCCFRDFIPFGWDTDTATCSLLINAAQDTVSDRWVNSLHNGDQVRYIKILAAPEKLHPNNLIVGLGDSSHLSCLLALQQLTKRASRFDGAVCFYNGQTRELFRRYFNTPLNTVGNRDELINWLAAQHYCIDHTSFYLGGSPCLVVDIKELLKNQGHRNIHAWSVGLSA